MNQTLLTGNKMAEQNKPLIKSTDLCDLSALDMLALLRNKEISAVELLQDHLQRIRQVNPRVNALVTLVDEDILLQQARAIDNGWMKGVWQGCLHGLPVSQKDLTATKGVRTTFGSRAFTDYVPTADALIVQRCTQAGALMIGKSNTPEFGAGSHTFNDVFGATLNPWDTTKSAGGSSGGTAVSIACGMNPVACGSDMGGSLRNPAAWNNVVGLRPSPGRVPRVPDANGWMTLGVDGPMGRTVADTALLLSAIAGPSAATPTEINEAGARFALPLQHDFKGCKLAISAGIPGIPVDPEIMTMVQAQAAIFDAMGLEVELMDVDFGHVEEVFRSERAWIMGGLVDSLPEHLRPLLKDEVHDEYRLYRSLSAGDLSRIFQQKTELFQRMKRFLDQYDFYVLPSCQMHPFPASQRWPNQFMGQDYGNYIDWMRQSWYLSSTEHPVLALPCGFSASGMPVGLQVVGRFRDEWSLLQFGHAYEMATQHGRTRPPLLSALTP